MTEMSKINSLRVKKYSQYIICRVSGLESRISRSAGVNIFSIKQTKIIINNKEIDLILMI